MAGPDTLALLQQLLAGQPLYRPEDRGNYLQRQPLAEPAEGNGGGFSPGPFDLPGAYPSRPNYGPLSPQLPPSEMPFGLGIPGGGYSIARPGRPSEPPNVQLQYNVSGLPLDLSSSYAMGRGGGLSNFMARYRAPF